MCPHCGWMTLKAIPDSPVPDAPYKLIIGCEFCKKYLFSVSRLGEWSVIFEEYKANAERIKTVDSISDCPCFYEEEL